MGRRLKNKMLQIIFLKMKRLKVNDMIFNIQPNFIKTAFGRLWFAHGVFQACGGKFIIYEWRDKDLSNFLHVFWQDALWNKLPFDCILIVKNFCITHDNYPTIEWLIEEDGIENEDDQD
jgi:hypothetical protein